MESKIFSYRVNNSGRKMGREGKIGRKMDRKPPEELNRYWIGIRPEYSPGRRTVR
jgi:hypothetical protein